jgi:mono/diheme cytochrome c family protein
VQSLGVSAVLAAWGPGKFDVRALPDNPLDDGVNDPTEMPQLWNFVDLEAQGYAYDWDGLFFSKTKMPDNSLASQAEAVYDLVMHANGAFGIPNVGNFTPELRVSPPQSLVNALVAAETAQPGNVIDTQKLLDVQDFERSIVSPAPGQFDEALAQTGFMLFNDPMKGNCASCHSTAEFTGPVITQITPTVLGGALANGIKTPGLRGLGRTAPYFHDGFAATLKDVVKTYVDQRIVPTLTDDEQTAIAEYLKSL